MEKRDHVFKVAAVQMSPVWMDRDGTTEKVLERIAVCGREGIRLVVFPETCIPSYPYFAWLEPPAVIAERHRKLYEEAVDVPGPVTDAVGKAAKGAGTVVVLGVNEREGGTLYNTQLIFDADGAFLGKRRKIMPTFHERMIWGWGDGDGLRVFETKAGRVGALICWEHFMPLARYALMAEGEQIHCAHFPGAMAGDSMSRQIDAAIRHHAMEAGAFVVNATGWLSDKQKKEILPDESLARYLRGGICTGIVAPYGLYLDGPLPEGEGMAVAEIDLHAIVRQKNVLDTAGHYSRPDLLRLMINRSPATRVADMTPPFEAVPGAMPLGECPDVESGG
ncbi:MAG: aliphatic nitrilase [Deltaproteobacteria bacterium]|nr:MAG: aliphatic nitrilase [Deltaproteobacteria bacterium]